MELKAVCTLLITKGSKSDGDLLDRLGRKFRSLAEGHRMKTGIEVVRGGSDSFEVVGGIGQNTS